MPELLIPDSLKPATDRLLGRFHDLLTESVTLVDDDGSYTTAQGIHAVETSQRLIEDFDDVLFDLNELVTRDLAARTLPATAVYAARAFMDTDHNVHFRLDWRQE